MNKRKEITKYKNKYGEKYNGFYKQTEKILYNFYKIDLDIELLHMQIENIKSNMDNVKGLEKTNDYITDNTSNKVIKNIELKNQIDEIRGKIQRLEMIKKIIENTIVTFNKIEKEIFILVYINQRDIKPRRIAQNNYIDKCTIYNNKHYIVCRFIDIFLKFNII